MFDEEIKKLEREVEKLEKHGESCCPECDLCMVCESLLKPLQAKLNQTEKLGKFVEDAVNKWVIDVDIDKINSKEYPQVFKLCEEINQRNKELKLKLNKEVKDVET